ncbi:unnamed protein product [Rotaria sp. Silwood2]|nr:unnamed protein product [Rotaria sp. Silwood2]
MLPFDFCCSSVKKELGKRMCKICNQYIPSAYRMKNHYKIHAQDHENVNHNQYDTLSLPAKLTDIKTNSNENQATTTTTAPAPILKTEMLDWLRSDFDRCDTSVTSTQLTTDRVTRSMKKLHVQENKDEHDNKDSVHVA